MIIYDGEADGQTKEETYEGLTLRHPEAAHTQTNTLLPDYATSEAQHWKVVQPEEKKPRLLDSRLMKGALYALALYVFLSVVIVTPIVVTKSRKEYYGQGYIVPTPSLWSIESKVFSTPLELSPAGAMALDSNKTCNVWNSTTAWNNTSALRFTLPASGLVTIRSNVTSNFTADQIKGSLTVSLNEDLTAQDIAFHVEAQFSSDDLRRKTHVCTASRGSDRGLSIFVPEQLGNEDNLNLKIQVLIPGHGAIDSLVTALPMLSQNFDDLRSQLSINEFYVEGSTRPILCKYLQAPRILVKNVAGSVQGNFNATDSIILDSIKGSIISNVTLTRTFACTKPILLNMDTGDSPLQSHIVLDSVGPVPYTPNTPPFIAKVGNFNGPLDLNVSYGSNAFGSPLHLEVENNLAETNVAIGATYQGSFSAKSKLSQVTVTTSRDSPEYTPPYVQTSQTLIYDQNSDDMTSGWIGWGPRPMTNNWKQSYIDIASALNPVALTFG